MLDSPILRVMPPIEQTLVTRNVVLSEAMISRHAPKWWSEPNAWIANDAQPEIQKVNRAAKALLAEYANLIRPAIRQGILAQTDVAFSTEDWDEDDKLPSLDSYRCMLKGLIELAPTSRPNLTISNSGNIVAGWFSDRGRSIFEFLPNERIEWVISRGEGETINRAAGIEPIGRIRMIADAHEANLGNA